MSDFKFYLNLWVNQLLIDPNCKSLQKNQGIEIREVRVTLFGDPYRYLSVPDKRNHATFLRGSGSRYAISTCLGQ